MRYRCFEILSEGRFFVVQTDCFYEDSTQSDWKSFDNYFFEIISSEIFEQLANEASQTIEEAIAKHEADFEEIYDEFDELKKFRKK